VDALEHLHVLARYNRWANDAVLAAAHGLPSGALDADAGLGFGSIRQNLTHIFTAQHIWLSRLGAAPPHISDPAAQIDDALLASSDAFVRYVDGLSPDDLTVICDYRDSQGDPHARGVWQILTHALNHGTHHRAETGLALARHGRSPGDLDFVYFCRDVLDREGSQNE